MVLLTSSALSRGLCLHQTTHKKAAGQSWAQQVIAQVTGCTHARRGTMSRVHVHALFGCGEASEQRGCVVNGFAAFDRSCSSPLSNADGSRAVVALIISSNVDVLQLR